MHSAQHHRIVLFLGCAVITSSIIASLYYPWVHSIVRIQRSQFVIGYPLDIGLLKCFSSVCQEYDHLFRLLHDAEDKYRDNDSSNTPSFPSPHPSSAPSISSVIPPERRTDTPTSTAASTMKTNDTISANSTDESSIHFPPITIKKPYPLPVLPPSIHGVLPPTRDIVSQPLIDRNTLRNIVKPFEMASRMTIVFLSISTILCVFVLLVVVHDEIQFQWFHHQLHTPKTENRSVSNQIYERVPTGDQQSMTTTSRHCDSRQLLSTPSNKMEEGQRHPTSNSIIANNGGSTHDPPSSTQSVTARRLLEHSREEFPRPGRVKDLVTLFESPPGSRMNLLAYQQQQWEQKDIETDANQYILVGTNNRSIGREMSMNNYNNSDTFEGIMEKSDSNEEAGYVSKEEWRKKKTVLVFDNEDIDDVVSVVSDSEDASSFGSSDCADDNIGLYTSSYQNSTHRLIADNGNSIQMRDERNSEIENGDIKSIEEERSVVDIGSETTLKLQWHRCRNLNMVLAASLFMLFVALLAYVSFSAPMMQARGSYYRDSVWVITYGIMLGLCLNLRIAMAMLDEQEKMR